MRYLSVCSGIEAATVAWHPLGWEPAAFSEIEKFPRAVLQHHYPNVPLHGDFTTIKGDEYGPIDLLVGGTPCQDFSVAGLRAGIAGERGNLTREFLRLATRVAPRWVVWENVPGVLSSDGGRALGAFLGGLAHLGYGFAYRVLDAQYFNVAQRRARVFVVGCLGDWRRAAAVLFESESLRGHPAPRREARKGIAPTLSARTKGGGGLGTDFDLDGGLVAFGQNNTSGPVEVSHALQAHPGPMGRMDFGSETCLVPVQAFNWQSGGDGRGLDPQDTASALSCHQTPAIAFDTTQITSPANRSNPQPGDPCHTLAKGANAPAIAFAMRGREDGAVPEIHQQGDTVSALRAASGGSTQDMVAGMQVRRLTPRECERLQGFPDDYTLIQYRGKQAADGPRYKALGNSMAVPVMHWIGKRIAEVEEATR